MKYFHSLMSFIFLLSLLSVLPLRNPERAFAGEVMYPPGYALDFGSTYCAVDVPAGVWFSGDFTIEAWVFVKEHRNWARL
ncbi:MAG: hypothetical protein V2I97_12245, partial [Desulfococcaceae bacterium]|nr:hypothetical protein [Desulfococcaceae bacterium]